jgi:hypothetical protein
VSFTQFNRVGAGFGPQPIVKMSLAVACMLQASVPSFSRMAIRASVLWWAGGELASPVPK